MPETDKPSSNKSPCKLDDYSYELPKRLIAQRAISPRDSARLMVLNGNINDGKTENPQNPQNRNIEHRHFYNLPEYMHRGDVLVLNSTRVAKAKLSGRKSTGSPAEVVLERRLAPLEFECKVKAKKPRIGTMIEFASGSCVITGHTTRGDCDSFIIRLSSDKLFSEAKLPVPPYISRQLRDDEYQTVFARDAESLAAPTAGLHFTEELLQTVREKGVACVFITLHVSYGTFKSIDYGIEQFKMEPEQYEISEDAARQINERKGRLFVVGTTTLKALETSARLSDFGCIIPGKGTSRLFIYPPFEFTSGADALITNFHLPRSTLILLTCAFGSRERILGAYKEAIRKEYRFYSLGDAMLVFR